MSNATRVYEWLSFREFMFGVKPFPDPDPLQISA